MSAVERLLDAVGWRLVAELQVDGRASWRELGARVGLSAPAVAERVRRLEEAGVITGYRAEVDLTALGRGVRALVRMSPATVAARDALEVRLAGLEEVLTYHQVTGTDYFVLEVAVGSVVELHRLLDVLLEFAPTTSSVILASPVEDRAVRGLTAG